MRITFRRFPDRVSAYSVIELDDGRVYRMQEFTPGGSKLPHDLRHLIVELELGISDGIWGLIAQGAVYSSMQQVSGRQPVNVAAKSAALKKSHRHRLGRAELFANIAEDIARLDHPSVPEIQRITREKLSVVPLSEPGQDPADVVGMPPPEALVATASALQVAAARWARLRVGEELVYEWRYPTRAATPPGAAVAARARSAVPLPREPGDRREPGNGSPADRDAGDRNPEGRADPRRARRRGGR